MEIIDKKINDELNKEIEANESKLPHIKNYIFKIKNNL